MPVPPSVEAKLKNKLDTSLRKLATYEGNLPPTNSAREAAAGELYLANELKRRADSILKSAQQKALIEGVIIDKETSTLQPKENRLTYDGEHTSVMVLVSTGALRYPVADIRTELVRRGMARADIDSLFDKVEKQNKHAHEFRAVLKIGDSPPNN